MARRVFEIAKELNIPAKVIVEKCHAEGIPESSVRNHMSTISVGLEATIRDWFSTSSGSGTAVEVAERVDVEKVRVKPRRAKAGEDRLAPPATIESTPEVLPAEDGLAPPAEPEPPPTPVARPRAAPRTIAPSEPAPIAPVTVFEPITPPSEVEAPAPKPISIPALPPEPALAPAARVAPPEPPPAPPRAAPAPSAPARTPPSPPRLPDPTRAPVNVPTRPKLVAPAGPKLQTQTPVKLAGPRVVRVEAPEVIDVPRARRPASSGPEIQSSGGPRGGGGVTQRPGGGVADDDRGRSPRRKATGTASSSKRSSGTGVPDRRRGLAAPGGDWKPAGGAWSEQDLAEREARLARAGGLLRKRRQELKRQTGTGERALSAAETGGKVRIAAPFTIKDLSAATGVKGGEIVKKLMLQGVMAKINEGIDPAKAQEIMIDYDIELEVVEAKTAEEALTAAADERVMHDERRRGPVVTILGHVDHGKTSLLDKIRNTNVAAGEAGGITQKTSAFRVPVTVAGETKEVVFFDTPGHKAFTEMRARGANVTDVVVLVVSAPEGVMPQTIESINHAKAAGVPMVVALNKIDRPDATEPQIQKTLGELAAAGLNPVMWGGETEVVKVSAATGEGLTELLETLDYQAQLLDLKADFAGPAGGMVIEAKVEEGRGPVANILVTEGELKVGDFIVMGRAFGRIREITDDRGQRVRAAYPPMPVQVSGLDELPDAGDRFFVVDSLKKAQEAAEHRHQRERQAQLAQPKATLDSLFTQMADAQTKEILVVLKADLQGTVDVLKNEIQSVSGDEVKVRVLHGAVGGITESDVLLADASRAVIIGFNVIPSAKARSLAEVKGIEIRTYQVIYDITDDLKKAAEGLLAPELRETVLGHAEVRRVFKVSKVGSIAGCYVTDGTIERNALIRVTRSDVVIEHDRVLEQLKRFKDDAKEVRNGMECGMKIAGYDDIKEGDILECYRKVEVKRTLGGGERKAGAKA